MVNGENRTDELASFVSQHPRGVFSLGGYLHDAVVDKDYEETFENWEKQNPSFVSFMETVFSKKSLIHLKYWYGDMFHKRLLSISEPPVFHDQTKTQISAFNLQAHFKRLGYLDCEVIPQFFLEDESVEVIYHVTLHTPYTITSFQVDTTSSKLAKVYYDNLKSESLIQVGEVMNMDVFSKEVQRVTSWFHNHGYYFFRDQFVHFSLDTNHTKSVVRVRLKIDAEPIILTPSTEEKFAVDQPYTLQNIKIHINRPEKIKGIKDSSSLEGGQIILYDKGSERPFAPVFIKDRLYLEKGNIYSEKTKEDTYKKFLTSNNFSSVIFDFDPDTLGNINTNIYLLLRDKYSFSMEPNLSYSDSRWSIAGDISLQRRNLFSYGEYLNISASGSLGSLQNTAINIDFWNSWAINSNVELVFQTLLIPGLRSDFDTDVFPSTRLSLGVELQKNIGLGKIFYNAFWGYTITHGGQPMIHSLNLVDLQYSRLLERSNYFAIFSSQAEIVDAYLNKYRAFDPSQKIDRFDVVNNPPENAAFITENQVLHDDLLFASQTYHRITDDYLIGSFWYRFSYGTPHQNQKKSHIYFSAFMEWSGLYFSLWDQFYPLSTNKISGFKEVFDVAYAEFFKLEFDFRSYWKWGENAWFATRFFSGAAPPFGNSENLPFRKAYFAGGVSDIRAWGSYSLVSQLSNQSYSSQTLYTETFKALLSLEYRYLLFGNLHGAFFVDMGNIWSLEQLYLTYDQIALGVGAGLRYDVGVIVLRFDLASKTFDPIAPVGNRWNFKVLDPNKLTLNLGLGYPF